ncbi:MAG: ribosomal protein S18-alanine N-acetyltransferase [Marmoricola sp.]
MQVRAARVHDLDALVALEDECEGADAWSRALVADGLSGAVPTVSYLVAEGDSGVVGYAVVSCVDDIAELQRIGVTTGLRRSGIGSQLLEHALVLARREGTQRLLLEVREGNAAALAMYAAHGFVEIDRRPRYYRDGATAIVMRLPVAKGCSW